MFIDKNQSIPNRITALGELLLEKEEYVVKQAAIWDNFYQQQSARKVEINNNSVFQQANRRYERAISELLDLDDPKLAKFIWTLVDGILNEHISNNDSSSFATQIELLTQMLIAYFEKHILV
ncbi:MAG: hypothetical protein QNJ41_15255 [Xenococcaceae cyanobacterium MO_188.B32]|nr:hypothetical protein [Xenococcaceae cyanobacterium MO_188.B32]